LVFFIITAQVESIENTISVTSTRRCWNKINDCIY
jgi:hypothetical protein